MCEKVIPGIQRLAIVEQAVRQNSTNNQERSDTQVAGNSPIGLAVRYQHSNGFLYVGGRPIRKI